MPARRGRVPGSPIRLGIIAVVALMLSGLGCATSGRAEVCAACSSTAPADAAWTAPSTAITRRPTLEPSPTPLALPTFPLDAPTATRNPLAKQPKVTVTLEPKTQYRVWLNWALGPTDRQTGKVKDVAYGRYEPGDIVVEWWVNKWWMDSPPRPITLRWGAQLDASTILWSVRQPLADYTSVVLRGYLLSDSVQRNSDQAVLMVSLTYSRSTMDRIDFDAQEYLLSDRIFELADRSYFAPDFPADAPATP